ncbi:MAG: CS1-pili formation C-terminal domain-containing protein [Neisseriaceae bacterium]|nr:CS1-pili formation C-terminal domain-containing protein [Neisseriaceae bacterium]MBP6860738.1 CS1-pili formation C-terminal domain-containing protein [Neisseriaceae bacterium]
MQKQFIFNAKVIASSVIVAFASTGTASAQALSDVRLGEYIIPGMFGQALQQGLTVPIYLRFVDGDPGERQKVADAAIALKDGKLLIQEVVLNPENKGAVLSAETQAMILSLEEQYFDNSTRIHLTDDAELNLNVQSFVLTLDVTEEALSTAVIPRQFMLGASSVDSVSAVTTYDMGVYQTRVKNGVNNDNNYFNIRNTIGYKEHHFSLDGSVYGVGKGSEQSSEIYRAMYERDVNGNRLALGMFDTWNLQSIASLSALNASKVYGATFGNQSSTKLKSNQYSLTPITIFMPAAGEVHVFRNGRLLSIENFPMGSFEIDTGRLPFGIYDVDVEVMIDGEVRSKTTHRINKAFSNSNADINEVSWEVYGGYVDYDSNAQHLTGGTKETYLLGVSAAVNLPVLSGLSVQTSNYAFDNHFVNETAVNLTVFDYGSVGWQGLISEKGRYRNIVNATAMIPNGYGSVWVSKEKSNIKGDLGIYDSDTYSFGGTLNFNKFIDKGGSLTFSRTVDNRVNTRSNNFEYATSLYSGRRGTMSVRAGIQRYQYGNDTPTDNRKYISLGFSIPLSNWISVGLSSDNGDMNLDLSANKTFDDGPISSIGINTSKQLRDKTGRNSDFSTNAYAMFDTKYSAGTVSLSRPDSQRLNGNLTAGGSIAFGGGKVVPSGKREESGVIIQTNMTGGASLSAQVNGRNYKLTGKNNFIPLAPYAEYKVELMNDKNSMDSVNIVKGKTQNVTLYPGNVAVYRPEVKQLVTVFGRLTTEQGEALANAQIKNHIGKTVTDSSGAFSMDVDKRYPTISLVDDSQQCDVELDLAKAQGVLWVGDLDCGVGTQLAKAKAVKPVEPKLEEAVEAAPAQVVAAAKPIQISEAKALPLGKPVEVSEQAVVPVAKPIDLSMNADPRRYVPKALAPAAVVEQPMTVLATPMAEAASLVLQRNVIGAAKAATNGTHYYELTQKPAAESQPYVQTMDDTVAYLSEQIRLTTEFSDVSLRQGDACTAILKPEGQPNQEWANAVSCQSHLNVALNKE